MWVITFFRTPKWYPHVQLKIEDELGVKSTRSLDILLNHLNMGSCLVLITCILSRLNALWAFEFDKIIEAHGSISFGIL
jgi:hypothetical protein